MTFSRLLAAAATAAVLTFAGSAMAQEKIKIGTEGAYPPFNTVTADGKLVGFDIDIANALCAQMKVECEIVTQDWDGIIPALQAKKFDAIIASMSITEERKKQVAFTNKYYTTPLALVALKDSDLAATDPAALAGKTVGAQASTTQAVWVVRSTQAVRPETRHLSRRACARRWATSAVVASAWPRAGRMPKRFWKARKAAQSAGEAAPSTVMPGTPRAVRSCSMARCRLPSSFASGKARFPTRSLMPSGRPALIQPDKYPTADTVNRWIDRFRDSGRCERRI